jgi:hypothetical protein
MKCDSSLNADHLRISDTHNCLVSLTMGLVRGRVLFGKADCLRRAVAFPEDGLFFNHVVPNHLLGGLPTAL